MKIIVLGVLFGLTACCFQFCWRN